MQIMANQNPGSPEASAAIWEWQETEAISSDEPTAGAMRLRGLIQSAVGLSIAGLFFYFGHQAMAMVVAGITSFILLIALISPLRAFRSIQRGFLSFGGLVGRGVSWIVLPAVFYLFFLPFGSLFRRARRDTLKRYYEPDADSYWEACAGHGARTRQF